MPFKGSAVQAAGNLASCPAEPAFAQGLGGFEISLAPMMGKLPFQAVGELVTHAVAALGLKRRVIRQLGLRRLLRDLHRVWNMMQ